MSQQKVDRYKEEKANRKKIMQQKKMKALLMKIGAAVIAVAIVGWLGYSVYAKRAAEAPRTEVSVDTQAISDFMSEAHAAETEGTEEAAGETEESGSEEAEDAEDSAEAADSADSAEDAE